MGQGCGGDGEVVQQLEALCEESRACEEGVS